MLVAREGRFLLIRQETEHGTVWLPPGGTPEAGEAPAETACREFREETGVDVDLTADLGPVVSPRGHGTILFAGRIAEGAQPRAAGLPGEGLSQVAWLAPDDPAVDTFTRALLAAWREAPAEPAS